MSAFAQSIFDDQTEQRPTTAPAKSPKTDAPPNQPAAAPPARIASPDSASGASSDAKLAVPDAAALKNATSLVNDIYKSDIAAARTPDQKKAIVQKLLDAADGEKGARRYVLLTKAKELAVDSGDIERCDAALDGIEASFLVDSPALRSRTYSEIAPNVRLSPSRTRLCKDLSAVVRVAIAADRFDIARPDAELELRVARASDNPGLVKRATANIQTEHETAGAYANVKDALSELAKKPGDSQANLKAGKYRCFNKGDWNAGLPLLASGSDAPLSAIARQELAGSLRPTPR